MKQILLLTSFSTILAKNDPNKMSSPGMFSNSYLNERSLIIVRNIFIVVQYLFLIL